MVGKPSCLMSALEKLMRAAGSQQMQMPADADASRCGYQQIFGRYQQIFWQMPADLLAGASNKARAGR
jgi:hypothetical protein